MYPDVDTKYVTKSEPRSETVKDTFTRIVRSLKDGNKSLKAVQRLLIHTVGLFSSRDMPHLVAATDVQVIS